MLPGESGGAGGPASTEFLAVNSETKTQIHLGLGLGEDPGRGRCGTKPGSFLKTEIPIRAGTWDLSQPGYLEADSVAHCRASLAGDFIWSLTYTDIFSRWSEGKAVWNRGSAGSLKATEDVAWGQKRTQ